MQNQTTMDVFKELAVVRRRDGRSGSIVSDDDFDRNNDVDFCYYRQDTDSDAEMEDSLVGGTIVIGGGVNEDSSLYGRRRLNSGNMAVVTSSQFDSDEAFSEVARAMIDRYQHQKMTESEAIRGSLENNNDLRAFIEALDLRFTSLTSQIGDGDICSGYDEDDVLSELVVKTRSIFDATLKAMWREIELLSSPTNLEKTRREYIPKQQEQEDIAPEVDEYTRSRYPKAPKNLRMSPMLTSGFNYKNHGTICQSESLDSACSAGSSGSGIFQSFKRRRRWFFPQNNKTERFNPLITPQSTGVHKPFPIKASIPKFHFNFGGSSISISSNNSNINRNSRKRAFRNTSLVFGDPKGQGNPMKSLELDGKMASSYASMGEGNGTYMPPTSPIQRVSENECV